VWQVARLAIPATSTASFTARALRAYQVVEPGQLDAEHVAVQETLAVKEDVPLGPVHIRFLGPTAEMASPDGVAKPIEEAWRGGRGRAGLPRDRAVGRRGRIRDQHWDAAKHVGSVEPGPC